MKRALIIGVNGQDGAYLSKLLLDKGYEVIGASHDVMALSLANIMNLDVEKRVQAVSLTSNDSRSVLSVLKKFAPDEIYNLAVQTSIGISVELPVEAMENIGFGALNILEAIHLLESPIRYYGPGSGECYWDNNHHSSEKTPFSPRSPYAVAKTAAYGLVSNYRESYGLSRA